MPVAKLIAPTTKQEIPKLRVAAYCRVSSNSADQRNSFATQERVYTKYIAEKQEWELVDIFADEGLSGMKADNRPEFQRMIRMCELHQIDLILTKSVSRFARNAKEALNYTRKLKLLGIGVQFEEDGINTLAMADEMLLNTFAAIAQEESESISQNERLSIVKRMERGEYIATNVPYGYRLIDKKLVVYEPEAKIVRWIFDAYLNGMSATEIARELTAQGIPTKDNKANWKSNRLTYMLSNERYYKNRPRQHNPLSQQKEFRAIKNAIIQEAERLRQQMEQESSQDEESSTEKTSTGASTNPTLTDEYTSSVTSHSVRLPSEYLLNSTIRLFHQMGQIFRDNAAPPSNPMGIRIDSKRRKKLMQKRLAMGHKQDDHEQNYGQTLQ